jgi:hypothetical protein
MGYRRDLREEGDQHGERGGDCTTEKSRENVGIAFLRISLHARERTT